MNRSACKALIIFVRIKRNLTFPDRFTKNTQMSNLIKIRPVAVQSFHVDAPETRRKLNYLYRYISVVISADDRINQHKTDTFF
jgi:hypothetical protein